MTRRALVLGATGLVGSALVQQLALSDQWQSVTLLGRRHPPLPDDRFKALDADLGDMSASESAFAVDDVFCCLGTTLRKAGSREAFRRVDHDFCVDAARTAHAMGVKRFVMVSAVNASQTSLAFYARVKGETEADIAELGLPLVAFMRPSLLRGPREEVRFAEQASEKVLSLVTPLVSFTRASWLPIDADKVARAMLGVALHGPDSGVLRLYYRQMTAYAEQLESD